MVLNFQMKFIALHYNESRSPTLHAVSLHISKWCLLSVCGACECQGPGRMWRRGTRLSACRINPSYNCLKFDAWVRSDQQRHVEIAVYKSYITTFLSNTCRHACTHTHKHYTHTHTHTNTHTRTHTHLTLHTAFCQRIVTDKYSCRTRTNSENNFTQW